MTLMTVLFVHIGCNSQNDGQLQMKNKFLEVTIDQAGRITVLRVVGSKK